MTETTEISTPARKFMASSILGTVNIVITLAAALFLTPYVLHSIGDRFYGVFILVSSIAGWLGILDFGIGSSVGRFITVDYTRHDSKRCNETASTVFWLFIVLGIFCFLVSCGIIVGTQIIQPNMPDRTVFEKVLFFFGLACMVNFPTNVCEGILCGVLRHDVNAVRLIVFKLMGIIGLFLAIFLGGKAVAMAVANLLVNAVSLGIAYYLARRYFPAFRPQIRDFSLSRLREMIRYSWSVFLQQAADTTLARFGVILLSIMISMEAATPYNLVIVSLAGYSPILFYAMTNWQINWLTHLDVLNNRERFTRSVRTLYKLSIILITFVAFGYIALGKPFITCWIGPNYLTAYAPLVIFMIYTGCCYGQQITNWRILMAIDRHHIMSKLSVIQAILTVLIGMALVHWGYGMTGVVWATVIPGFLIHFFATSIYTCHVTGESVRRFYLTNMKTQLTGLLALVPAMIVTWYWARPSWIALIPVGIVDLILYVIAVFYLAFDHDERRYIIKLIVPEKEKQS